MEQFLTSAEILENATALVPEIQRRAAETAALRRIPADLVEKLRAAGVFRVMFSKSWGGPEMPLPQQVQLMETLAYGDPSVAWAVKIGTDSGYFCAFLDTGAARELYPSIDFATAGQAPPNGRAVRVPGGYRVTGRWGFASGCTHADVMVAGCLTLEAQTAPPTGMVFILAPASAFEIEDTWHSMGLAGSGSHHYRATNLFVPERHTFSLAGPARIAGPLYADAGSATVFIPMAGTPRAHAPGDRRDRRARRRKGDQPAATGHPDAPPAAGEVCPRPRADALRCGAGGGIRERQSLLGRTPGGRTWLTAGAA